MTWIRSSVIALIALSNLGSVLVTPLIYLDFELRRDYLAEVLCINRDQPITVCRAQCYLDDQLSRAAEQQEQEDQSTQEFQQIQFFQSDSHPIDLNTTFRWSAQKLHPESHATPIHRVIGIFRPPQG
ncbi:hypothetical protein [Marinoscillum furvescens]|uniref:Uncharacterized protein n=1 Tax=Marinoscillum furvescens DSM 4134 TaxID=1122208 RepID=A0A3D9L4D2_MARFU|nr:hypothetical protein [Marinoscillum furvescens]RED98431.1 hypothetical protein C7460_110103 [Marinoscillum furvescens DSM 4134]